MSANILLRPLRIAALALAVVAFMGPAEAQQQPSAQAIAIAQELLAVKGAASMWDPIVPGVIERVKSMFIQSNLGLAKDITDVAAQLRAELAPRSAELSSQVARIYATRFTEQELKDLLAFYKSPLGKKAISEEPKVIDDSMREVNQWAAKFSDEIIAKMRAEMKKKGHDL